jgi:hypothetical protein
MNLSEIIFRTPLNLNSDGENELLGEYILVDGRASNFLEFGFSNKRKFTNASIQNKT